MQTNAFMYIITGCLTWPGVITVCVHIYCAYISYGCGSRGEVGRSVGYTYAYIGVPRRTRFSDIENSIARTHAKPATAAGHRRKDKSLQLSLLFVKRTSILCTYIRSIYGDRSADVLYSFYLGRWPRGSTTVQRNPPLDACDIRVAFFQSTQTFLLHAICKINWPALLRCVVIARKVKKVLYSTTDG